MNKKPALLFEEWLMIGILSIQVSLVCACVLSRYAFNWSISFTEELTRHLLIWLTGLGFSASYARNELMGFRWPGQRPEWLNKTLHWLGIIAGSLFSILLLLSSLQMIHLQWRYRQLTSVMEWPIVLIGAAFPTAAILYLVRTILRLRSSRKTNGKGVFLIFILLLPIAPSSTWKQEIVSFPTYTETGKSVAIGDIDLDRTQDIVVSCENAFEDRAGVFWMQQRDSLWISHPGSGPEGVKFDRVELLDLDGGGDLDILTCEESENLGVIGYENPC